MSEPIYFQWQNEHLLRTIYPLRETKLRDFLLYFHEIDLWKKYKDLPVQSLAAEVNAYRSDQKAKIHQAYARYQELEAYLLDEDVTDKYASSFPNLELDTTVMAQINEVHKTFKRFFPNYKNPTKEKYFATERVRQMEALHKTVQSQIAEKQRILRNNGPDWVGKGRYDNELQRLSTVSLKMVEKELNLLIGFVGAYEFLFQYKKEALKQRAEREKELQVENSKLPGLRSELETLQARLRAVQESLQRMKNPPKIEVLKAYLLDEDVTDIYVQKVGNPDPAVMRTINQAHSAFMTFFPTYNNLVKEKHFISQRLSEIDNLRKLKQQELATATRLVNTSNMAALKKSLQVLDEELSKWADFQWVYENQGKPTSNFTEQIGRAEKEQFDIQSKIRAVHESILHHETALNQIKAVISTSDRDMMLSSIDALPVTAGDIVRKHAEDYKNSLMQKNSGELLELVVQAFMQDPTRYPLWVQYMVVHFSGMRYQSAHGSWADPKDILLSLRMRSIEQKLKQAGEDSIRCMSEARFLCYHSQGSAPIEDGGSQVKIPALASAKDAYWQRRIEHHRKALDPSSWHNKTKALLDVQIDEEDYEIQQMTEQQALSQLEDLKDSIPDWMWKEIVRSTNLRLTQVQQGDWENLTKDEIEERYAAGMGPYREMLNKWKQDHLTGWREEHDRTEQLIVTRAVCNEVAEHIQHLRGRKPPGGLTAKPEWYKRNEKDPRLAHVPDKPYFAKLKTAEDFRPGASIFWLRWVNKEPNIWQITRPFVMGNGEELVPALKDDRNEITNTGSAFLRRVRFEEIGPSGNTVERQSQQWLRWMHEATVVEVAETADGLTVLTFETALPGEDRRQSTIGVFKRYAADLKYSVSAGLMNGTFAGYIPEGAVPYESLRDMLNWNRVLLRSAYTPAELEQYWQKVTKPIDPSIAFAAEIFYPEILVEVSPQLSQEHYQDWAVCYEVNPETRRLEVYRPEVALRRGVRLLVSKEQSEKYGDERYHLVTHCDYEPRSEGLYVRAKELLAVPEGPSQRSGKARKGSALYRLSRVDEQMQPVFEESGLWIKAGTRFLASTVQKGSLRDIGDGTVQGQGRQGYYLIIACPDAPAAEGLFIRRSEQRKIDRGHETATH